MGDTLGRAERTDSPHVSVVSSVHRETGRATADELLTLLELLRPDVVFLELAPSNFDSWFDGRRTCLEATASDLYRSRHGVPLVPVGLSEPDLELARESDYLLDTVAEANPEYVQLDNLNRRLVATHGFAYLNSGDSSALWERIQKAMEATVASLADDRLTEAYAKWVHAHRLRETAIVRGVEEYATASPFERGVLLVGLAHRKPIRDMVVGIPGDGLRPVRWDFLVAGRQRALHARKSPRRFTR